MATIAMTRTSAAYGVEVITSGTITQADATAVFQPGSRRQIGSVQATGTFTSATLALQGSNDGTNYVTIEDIQGNAASLSAAGLIEFQTTFLYYKLQGGGTTLSAVATVVLRDA